MQFKYRANMVHSALKIWKMVQFGGDASNGFFENKKSSGQKTREIKEFNFTKKIFWPNSIFCDFKNGQKSCFELGKSLKLPEMQFHEKKNWFIWFHEFFCLDFFKFYGPLCKWLRKVKTKTNHPISNVSNTSIF